LVVVGAIGRGRLAVSSCFPLFLSLSLVLARMDCSRARALSLWFLRTWTVLLLPLKGSSSNNSITSGNTLLQVSRKYLSNSNTSYTTLLQMDSSAAAIQGFLVVIIVLLLIILYHRIWEIPL
jgi:hypothetical protein